MKVLFLLCSFAVMQAFAVSIVHFLERDYKINSKYGNVTEIINNQTHFGEITLYYFQKISSFVKKALIVSEKGKVMMNTTVKPCERKTNRRIDLLVEKVMGSSGFTAPPEPVKCPCNIGKTVLSPRLKLLRLPMVVPSVFIEAGNYQVLITFTAISKGKSELFLTSTVTYRVEDVQE